MNSIPEPIPILSPKFQQLPLDIITQIIIPYTYSIQSKELCQDIVNYVTTYSYMKRLSNKRYASYIKNTYQIYNIDEDDIQLKELYLYFYDFPYHRYFILDILRRYKPLANYSDVEIVNYISGLFLQHSNKYQLNLIWGLLTTDERQHYIQCIEQ